jgi:hypothetical protein
MNTALARVRVLDRRTVLVAPGQNRLDLRIGQPVDEQAERFLAEDLGHVA